MTAQTVLFRRGTTISNLGNLIISRAKSALSDLHSLGEEERITVINELRKLIHSESPFSSEPVDCVLWIPSEEVIANDYNPNSVAPPEMQLLEHSIEADGYTQPIVAWINGDSYEVVDGFHRNRVGRECPNITKRLRGYLPLSIINPDREDRGDRIAATIRHNRARGKHRVDSMSEIVVELKRRNWSDEKIGRELGMEPDEVLRLTQITGLAEMFADQDFSKSWDVEGEVTEEDFMQLTDDISTYGDEVAEFRTVNTSDEGRIFHTHDKWECFKAGFYDRFKEGMSRPECEVAYRDFFADSAKFSEALEHVIYEWKHSCEQYLTNQAMNRIAWLGQAAACYAVKIPAVFRGGFWLLSEEQQDQANRVALIYLNKWLVANGRPEVTLEEAMTGRQSDLY